MDVSETQVLVQGTDDSAIMSIPKKGEPLNCV